MDSAEKVTVTKRYDSTVAPLAAFEAAIRLLQLPITDVETAVAEKTHDDSYTIRHAKGCVTDPTAKLVHVSEDGSLVLAWRIETDIGSNWLVSYVDAVSGSEITGVVEYKNNASYEA